MHWYLPCLYMSLFPCYKCSSSSQPSHPVNRFHCFQETFEKLLPLAPSSRTSTAFAVPWLQWITSKTPRSRGRDDETAATLDASWKKRWLHRNRRNFMWKKAPLGTRKTPLHFYSTNFKVGQSPFQNLRCLAPSDKRTVETDISLLHHSHSVPLDPSPHQSPHTSRWIQLPSWQTPSEPHQRCSWKPSLVMNVEKKIRANSNESWQVMLWVMVRVRHGHDPIFFLCKPFSQDFQAWSPKSVLVAQSRDQDAICLYSQKS